MHGQRQRPHATQSAHSQYQRDDRLPVYLTTPSSYRTAITLQPGANHTHTVECTKVLYVWTPSARD